MLKSAACNSHPPKAKNLQSGAASVRRAENFAVVPENTSRGERFEDKVQTKDRIYSQSREGYDSQIQDGVQQSCPGPGNYP